MENNKSLEEENAALKKRMGEMQAELDNIEQHRKNILRIRKIFALSAISVYLILMLLALCVSIASRTATWFSVFICILILGLIVSMVGVIRAKR